jgi:predicted outer membrane protein
MKRSVAWFAAACIAAALSASAVSTRAQASGAQPGQSAAAATSAQHLFDLAFSSADLQAKAAALAATRNTRAEVKSLAQNMQAFRQAQLQRLQALAQERKLKLPSVERFEHKVMLENLEPLDYLALSRRYAEFQVQALEQELQIYEAAARGEDDGLKRLAQEMAPKLQEQLTAARAAFETVKP